MNKFKIQDLTLFSLLICILCVSCSSSPYSKTTRTGLDELKKMCEKDAGLTVYETVGADGYYDDTTQCHHCWQGLIDRSSQYVEFCTDGSLRSPLIYILKEPGCYRLSKVPRSSGQCHVGIDKSLSKIVIEPIASYKVDQCIKVESIEKPSQGVGLYLKKDEKVVVGEKFDISRYEYTIESNIHNKKYGRYVDYSLEVYTVNGAQHTCGPKYFTDDGNPLIRPSLYKYFIRKVIQN